MGRLNPLRSHVVACRARDQTPPFPFPSPSQNSARIFFFFHPRAGKDGECEPRREAASLLVRNVRERAANGIEYRSARVNDRENPRG